MNGIKKFFLLLMLAVPLVCAGCDDQGQGNKSVDNPKTEKTDTLDKKTNHNEKDPDLPPSPPQSANDSKHIDETRNAKKMKVKVYYPDESGLRLVGVNREILVTEQNDKYKAAVEAVMTPPTESNLTSVIPNKNSLISVKVKDGTATVNLDKKIKNGFSGGSTGEEFLIGSVVNTLTEFKEIKNVKFLIDGHEVETLSGHMDLSTPIERMNNLING